MMFMYNCKRERERGSQLFTFAVAIIQETLATLLTAVRGRPSKGRSSKWKRRIGGLICGNRNRCWLRWHSWRQRFGVNRGQCLVRAANFGTISNIETR